MEEPVKVILRRFKRDPKNVIALFPGIEGSQPHLRLSYMRVGQHGEYATNHMQCVSTIIRVKDLDKEENKDARDLLKELESIGYTLKISERMSPYR